MEEFKLSKEELCFIHEALIHYPLAIELSDNEEKYNEKLISKIWNEIN